SGQRVNRLKPVLVALGDRHIDITKELCRFEGRMHEVIGVVAVPEIKGVADFMTGNISGSGTAEGLSKRFAAELDRCALHLTGERGRGPWQRGSECRTTAYLHLNDDVGLLHAADQHELWSIVDLAEDGIPIVDRPFNIEDCLGCHSPGGLDQYRHLGFIPAHPKEV